MGISLPVQVLLPTVIVHVAIAFVVRFYRVTFAAHTLCDNKQRGGREDKVHSSVESVLYITLEYLGSHEVIHVHGGRAARVLLPQTELRSRVTCMTTRQP